MTVRLVNPVPHECNALLYVSGGCYQGASGNAQSVSVSSREKVMPPEMTVKTLAIVDPKEFFEIYVQI